MFLICKTINKQLLPKSWLGNTSFILGNALVYSNVLVYTSNLYIRFLNMYNLRFKTNKSFDDMGSTDRAEDLENAASSKKKWLIKIQKIPGCKDSIDLKKAHASDSGFDLQANLDFPVSLGPGQRMVIGAGLFMEIPEGLDVQIRSRSGLSLKNGIIVINAPGTIDAGYRGEIKVIIFNAGGSEFVIEPGMKIAQLVINLLAEVSIVKAPVEQTTDRASGGFGSTGQ